MAFLGLIWGSQMPLLKAKIPRLNKKPGILQGGYEVEKAEKAAQ